MSSHEVLQLPTPLDDFWSIILLFWLGVQPPVETKNTSVQISICLCRKIAKAKYLVFRHVVFRENEIKQKQFSVESRQFLEKKKGGRGGVGGLSKSPVFHWKRISMQNVHPTLKYRNKHKLMECSVSGYLLTLTLSHIKTHTHLKRTDC